MERNILKRWSSGWSFLIFLLFLEQEVCGNGSDQYENCGYEPCGPHHPPPPPPPVPTTPEPELPGPVSRTKFDPASFQLENWADHHSLASAGYVKDDQGYPVPSLTATLGVGQHGPALFQDQFLLNKLAEFNRERIPERVVHAKGHGAFGYFRVTHDLSTLTKADFLNGVGKTTPVLVRFSVVAGESGSTDLARDVIGFAIKFYTNDGIFDLLGCGVLGVFPIRDAMLFPDLNRSRKRNPQTHLPDPTMFWDFTSLNPESILQTLALFSDFPSNSRVTSAFGVNAFKFVNKEGDIVFVKLHFISDQPFTWFNSTEMEIVSGMDPDHNTRDLYNAIANKNYPKWTVKIQVMTAEQALTYPVNPFDATKVWREEEFPLMTIGELVLNRNPENYFNDIEQSAFSVARLVPGIEPSPDKMLLARIFVYSDTQRYRLGTNFAQLEVNRPKYPLNNYIRDGFMKANPNGAGEPNYFPNSFHGPRVNGSTFEAIFHVKGLVDRIDNREDVDDNFRLARLFLYKDKTKGQRHRIAENLGASLAKANQDIRERAVKDLFYRISQEFGSDVWEEMHLALANMKKNNEIVADD